jgi:dTMP kinase
MLVCFEGIDGSGKTTISSAVAARLRQLGGGVFHSRENERMASRIARELREVTRNAENFTLDPRAELSINLAREAELYAAVRGRLERGETVICDRFVYSHFVLARLRGLTVGLDELVGLATGGREPDLVIFVDCDPDIAWLRKHARKIATYDVDEQGRKGAVFEDLGRKLRESYLALAKARSWRVLDNSYVTAAHTIGRAVETIRGGADLEG